MPHSHGSFQFTCVMEGKFFIEFPKGELCEIGPGDAILLCPEMSHVWRSTPGLNTLAASIFCDSFQPGQYGELSEWLAPWVRGKYWKAHITGKRVLLHMKRIKGIIASHSKMENSLLFIEHLSLLADFMELVSGKHRIPQETRPSTATLKALYRIEADYMKDLSLEELAKSSGLSVSRFSSSFHAEMDKAPIQYLNNFRIGKASELLLYSKLPIAEVARMTGFSSEHYFSRAFRRQTGQAPGAYRKRCDTE
ncbi:MAG: hypothetical protein A2X49_12305 [Lentisphaerae bacterium GWF2_52_8]|nr:MAG: hypothetical protein A2X49_12305 [Lentisphaerae bacterium GWF2_52_8]